MKRNGTGVLKTLKFRNSQKFQKNARDYQMTKSDDLSSSLFDLSRKIALFEQKIFLVAI